MTALTDALSRTEPDPGHGYQSTRGHGIEATPAQLVAVAGSKPKPASPDTVASAGAPLQSPTHHELLITQQRQQHDVATALAQLVQLVDRKPAQLRDVTLTAAQPIKRSCGESALSFGIYNPSDVVIYTNVGGVDPAPGRGAMSFPGRSLVVLPLATEGDLSFGADPAALAGGNLVFWVLLFRTVQAPYMQALA